MPRRTCLFCGGRPLTNEHALAQWLAGPLGVDGVPVEHEYLLRPESGGGQPQRRVWVSSKGLDIKVKAVCGVCNNGWMNKLETGVRPFLTQLIQGRGLVSLGHARRALLVRWLLKTIAMHQLAEPEELRKVPPDLAQEAYLRATPSNRFQVWAASNSYDAGIAFGALPADIQLEDAAPVRHWIHALVLRRLTLVTVDLGEFKPMYVKGPLEHVLVPLRPLGLARPYFRMLAALGRSRSRSLRISWHTRLFELAALGIETTIVVPGSFPTDEPLCARRPP
jgi:hypothetical protein